MSIRVKLALSIFFVELAFLVLLVARDLQTIWTTQYDYLSRRAQSAARRLGAGMVQPFQSRSITEMKDVAEHMLRSTDVVYTVFLDPGGEVLADSSKDPAALAQVLAGEDHPGILDAEAMIVDESGAVLGSIRVGYSTANVEAAVQSTLRSDVVLSLLGLVVIAAVAYGLGAVLTRSIGDLVQATEQISAGDLDTRVQVTSHDEVGRLGRALNSMAFQLKKAFDRIQFSEQQYRFLVDNAEDAIFALDLQGRFTHLNPKAEEITGFPASELLRQPVSKLLSLHDQSRVAERLEELRRGSVVGPITVQIHGNERSRVVEVNAVPIRRNGQVIGVQGIARDVTERQRQARMKEALFRLSQATAHAERQEDLAADALHVLHDLLEVERSAVLLKEPSAESFRLLAHRGWDGSETEATGTDDLSSILTTPEAASDGEEVSAPPRLIREEHSQETSNTFLLPLRVEDHLVGAIRIVRRDSGCFSENDEALLQVIANGLAAGLERKRLEEHTRRMHEEVLSANAQLQETVEKLESTQRQLIQSEKLSAIGQLVSGVAHELNNPLTGVIGFAELLLEQDLDPGVAADVRRIHREASRCERIVRSLLTVARQSQPEKVLLSVNDLLETVIELRRYHLKVENISIEADLAADLPQVLGDPNQLQQVFLNLITNAAQAIGSAKLSGTVWVRTHSKGGTVLIEVKDDGPGIASEHLTRVFDPFFTTKEVGEGTGLGLSISYSLIEGHGGRIWVESKRGEGTSFYVELPACANEDAPVDTPKGNGAEEASRSARILIVDDEEVVLGFMVRLLERDGHQVEAARNAQEAIDLLRDSRFDLVVSDVKMPGLNVEHLYAKLRASQPAFCSRLVFMTGDTISDVTSSFLHRVDCPVLRKPFTAEKVRQMIRQMLQAPQSSIPSA